MDEESYRELYQRYNHRRCLFEKAILATHCQCNRARKLLLAEREAVRCESDVGQARCARWLDTLHQAARFALRSREGRTSLPHAKAIRLQVGGLRGLYGVLHSDEPVPTPIPDIAGLLEEAEARPGGFETLPFEPIIQAVNAWEGRRPKRRRR